MSKTRSVQIPADALDCCDEVLRDCKRFGLQINKQMFYGALLVDALERLTYKFKGAKADSIILDVTKVVGYYYTEYMEED